MATIADLAGGAAGAAAVLAIVLTVLALRAWRATRSQRSLWLAAAFVVSAGQAGLTGILLVGQANVSVPWLIVPLAHAGAMILLYVALLRV